MTGVILVRLIKLNKKCNSHNPQQPVTIGGSSNQVKISPAAAPFSQLPSKVQSQRLRIVSQFHRMAKGHVYVRVCGRV